MASSYSILLSNQAKKELSKIRKGDLRSAKAISEAIDSLRLDPVIGEFLHGDLKGRRKIRVGNYRIIYSFEKNKLVIFIFRIAHRKESYR